MDAIQIIVKLKKKVFVHSSKGLGIRSLEKTIQELKALRFRLHGNYPQRSSNSAWIEINGVNVTDLEIKNLLRDTSRMSWSAGKRFTNKSDMSRAIIKRCVSEAKALKIGARSFDPQAPQPPLPETSPLAGMAKELVDMILGPEPLEPPPHPLETTKECTMSLTIKMHPPEKKSIGFPCLMAERSNIDVVYLMTAPNEGTALRTGECTHPHPGEHRTDLIFEDLQLFTGGITLEQA